MSIKDGNYFVVQSFMINDLKLKSGAERDIYAVIYGFSQDGMSKFTGSIAYLTNWTCTSKTTVVNALQSLCEKNYIIKECYEVGGVHLCRYYANLDLLKQLKSKCFNEDRNEESNDNIHQEKEKDGIPENGKGLQPFDGSQNSGIPKNDIGVQKTNEGISEIYTGIPNTVPNNLDNNTKFKLGINSIKSNQGNNDGQDQKRNAYEENLEIVKNQIEYQELCFNSSMKEELNEIVNIITEIYMTNTPTMQIAKNTWNTEDIQHRFKQLRSNHISYVLNCLEKNTTKIHNIKKYLIATLFNAPITINYYYRLLMNYDDVQQK